MGLIKRSEKRAWDPMRELEEMSTRLNRLFGAPFTWTGNGGESMAFADWTPSCNIVENGHEYRIEAELPGVKEKDVHVTLEGGMLTIRGERKEEKEEKGAKLHRMESSYGSFIRTFSMPEDADDDQISATFKNGMLTVHIGKTGEKKAEATREVPIQS